jgi:hypothetical protein
MSPTSEFWLTDDAGRRITLLKNFSSASYSRSTRGLGVIQFGLPLAEWMAFVPVVFQPDWRIDVWRSAETGYPTRREGSYFLRKYRIYDRETDDVRMIEFNGRSPIDILRRWSVTSSTHSDTTKTDYLDDMMKVIVTKEFVTGAHCVPAGEFAVDGEASLGPSVTYTFFGKTVLDAVTELQKMSLDLNASDSTSRKIYFDVVEGPGLTGGFGYIFRTFADLRGTDRSNVIFSPENGNLKSPEYSEDYLEEVTDCQVGVTTVTTPDMYLSRWNDIMEYQSKTANADLNADKARAHKLLSSKAKVLSLGAQFLSTPGSPTEPRCLYGVDWDFGDLVSVQYAGKNMTAEVEIVWVSVDENGQETIVGLNKVGT